MIFLRMSSTHSEVDLTAAHYVIQKRVLLHYLQRNIRDGII